MRPDLEISYGAGVSACQAPARKDGLLLLLFLVGLFHFIDRSLLIIAIEPIRAEFGLDDFTLSLLAGAAYSLPYAVALIPLGGLADRCDRARLLAALLFLFSLATGLIGLAGSLVVLIIARMAVGSSEAGVIPASLSLLADRFSPADRSRAFGIFFFANALGTVLCFGIGGFVMEEFGWRMPFLAISCAGLAAAVVLLRYLRDPRPIRAANQGPGLHGGLSCIFRSAGLPALLSGGGFGTALMVGYWAWAASLFQREFGLSVGQAGGLLASGAGVAAGIGTCMAGMMHSRLRRARHGMARLFPAITSILSALFVFGSAASHHVAVAIAFFIGASFLLPMFLPIVFATGSEAVPPDLSATQAAIQQFANNALGAAIGPASVGAISAASGSLRTGLLWLATAGILSAFCFLLAARRAPPLPVTTHPADPCQPDSGGLVPSHEAVNG